MSATAGYPANVCTRCSKPIDDHWYVKSSTEQQKPTCPKEQSK